jgi:hypothetical protein
MPSQCYRFFYKFRHSRRRQIFRHHNRKPGGLVYGGQWQGLGSGVDHTVHALAYDSQFLCVGGAFQNAGQKPSGYFGRWGLHRSYLPSIYK